MQPSVIAILIFCLASAALIYYLGYKLPHFAFQFLSQASFVVLTFMIIPFLIYTLWSQTGEIDRLQETGVVSHPAIDSSLGLTTSLKNSPTWVFSIDPSVESVREFYLEEKNRPGWDILRDDPDWFVLKRNNETMTITLNKTRSEASIIYLLHSK